MKDLKEKLVVILNETPQDQEMDKLLELFSQQKQEIVEEIRGRFEDNSLESEKTCELYLDHNPMWDGNYFTCENCGMQFISIKELKQILTNK